MACLLGHKWNGCICSRCGVARDEGHHWVSDKKCKEHCSVCGQVKEQHSFNGCRCMRCGAIRGERHNWENCVCKRCGSIRDEQHIWDGCVCSKCKTARDEAHDWDGCICKKCKKKRDEAHAWDGCTCKKCKTVRNEQHVFIKCKCKKCGKTDQNQKQHTWKLNQSFIYRNVKFDFYKGYELATVNRPIEVMCIDCKKHESYIEGHICKNCLNPCEVSWDRQGTIMFTYVRCTHCGRDDIYEFSDSY